MSAIAVVAGSALYFTLQKSFRLPGYTPQRWSGKASFTCLIDSLFAFAGKLTARHRKRLAAALVGPGWWRSRCCLRSRLSGRPTRCLLPARVS
jgi:hypothetical protein